MKSLCMVFPVPARYFDDMMEACLQLHDFYQKAAVYPLYVATMKRPYYFENAQGDYGEFERGNRFLVFYGEPAYFHPEDLFHNSFPTPSLADEVRWEGIDFQIGVVPIDDMLGQTLTDLQIGLNTYTDNDWMLIEEYSSFISAFHAGQEDYI